MDQIIVSVLNGTIYGLLLFMVSAGLTLIFGMMGVLNFAHASFYMLGAYFAYTLQGALGFWPAVVLSPACSSFDMFRDYAHRAQVFCDAVRALPSASGAQS